MLSDRQIENGALGALVLLAGVAAVQGRRRSARADVRCEALEHTSRQRAVIMAAHRLNRASGLIATSTLLDSAIVHYRGAFHNKAMVTPLLVSAATIAVSVHGTGDPRPMAHRDSAPDRRSARK
jgi:hypothetical protein